MASEWLSLFDDLYKAFGETALMVGVSTVFAIIGGLPVGFLLYIADRKLFWDNPLVSSVGSLLVNVIRSVPFVILLVLLLPLTQFVLGTTIGPAAASVPLSVAAIAFYARLVQSALFEVDPGIIEAAQAFGASPARILGIVLFREAMPGFLRGLTITLISLIGYSAMAGIVGGGGVGDLAIRFGYYRYQTNVMLVTVFILIVLVQFVQIAGDRLATYSDRKGS
ncbi:methionine ABC transporter permease [Uliginosibacterium gangwonense]|uniref:methionine ABC transporter permease n=1 Tax=Uliginosibacterium gangwonense TaxID=392736 RepID=UPI00037779EC|nr:methionine ABC transporter permease [Uliginosibacterium gangwonense]